MKFRIALVCLTALVLALAVAAPAPATTYVMVSDDNLLERSSAVVQARVLSADGSPSSTSPTTDYMIEVDRVLAGEVSGRNLIVRVPGGQRPDGSGLHFFGMPGFTAGERVMLFLGTRPDGTYRIVHLMLGAFHETVLNGERVLVRNLTGARELAMPGARPEVRERYHQPRRAEAFARWVEARDRGDEAAGDYFVEEVADAGALSRIDERFRLFNSGGNNIRWFTFDDGGSVPWRMQAGGMPPYGQNRTADAFQKGMAAWNNDGGSNVDYRYVGTTTSTQGFDGCGGADCTDGINAIIFGDVDGSIGEPFDCSPGGGGTLAIGGPWFASSGRPGPGGQPYNETVEAEIVINADIDCFLDAVPNGPDLAMQQLFGHELGHTLGIDHPCDGADNCPSPQGEALMRAFFQTDGRGAVLNSDDRGAVRALYPGASARPAPPTNLTGVALSAVEVLLSWTDNADNEDFFRVQAKMGDGIFSDLDGNPLRDSEEFLVEDLQPETLYTFRVEARNAAGGSGFSNELQILTPPDLPAAPENLAAVPLSSTSVGLSWSDMADDENDFVVEMRTPDSGVWTTVRTGILPDSENTTLTGLETDRVYAFRVFSRNEKGLSFPSEPAAATLANGAPDGCTPGDQVLCLLDDRFRVSVEWRNQFNGDNGAAGAEPLPGSDRSGTFWFFNPDNVELIVKVLDGRVVNDFFWTFHGALSNVEYWITVVDTADGASRTYYNPPGDRCGELDVTSIADDQPVDPGPGGSIALPAPAGSAGGTVTAPLTGVTAGTCTGDATTLCLLDGRFAVSVEWDNSQRGGGTGVGTAVPGSDRTGYFWFFDEANIELVVKALDGRAVNGNFWFFYGQLSDVEFDITVTDTVTEATRTYSNPFRNTCGQFDTEAFTSE